MRDENNNRGFWLGLPWQRKGFMSEAVEVVTDYWFHELKFATIRAPKAIATRPSRRISEKSGMRVVAVEERDYVAGRFLSEIWEITPRSGALIATPTRSPLRQTTWSYSHLGLWPGRWSRTRRSEIDPAW